MRRKRATPEDETHSRLLEPEPLLSPLLCTHASSLPLGYKHGFPVRATPSAHVHYSIPSYLTSFQDLDNLLSRKAPTKKKTPSPTSPSLHPRVASARPGTRGIAQAFCVLVAVHMCMSMQSSARMTVGTTAVDGLCIFLMGHPVGCRGG